MSAQQDIRKALEEIEQWFEKREAVAGDLGALDEQLEMAGLAGRVAGLRAALAQPQAAQPEAVAMYIDQIDAETEAESWLMGMVPTDRHRVFWKLERFSFAPHDGRALVLRNNERIVAAALCVRDGLNRTNLVRFATPPTEPALQAESQSKAMATAEEIEMLVKSGGLKGPADAWTMLRNAIASAISQPAPQAEPVSRTVTDTPGMPGCKDITTRYKLAQAEPAAPDSKALLTFYNDLRLALRRYDAGTNSPADLVTAVQIALAVVAPLAEPAAVGELPPLPEPAEKGSEGICCGNFTTGAEYMGQREELCCGRPDEAWPDYYTADQMRDYARAALASAPRAQEPWVCHVQCPRHQGQPYTLTATVQQPTKVVCPNCEQEKQKT